MPVHTFQGPCENVTQYSTLISIISAKVMSRIMCACSPAAGLQLIICCHFTESASFLWQVRKFRDCWVTVFMLESQVDSVMIFLTLEEGMNQQLQSECQTVASTYHPQAVVFMLQADSLRRSTMFQNLATKCHIQSVP